MKRAAIAALAFAILAGPAAAAGARFVTVVNLSGYAAHAVFDQGLGPVVSGPVSDRRDATFGMPEGSTGLVVTTMACRSARLALPNQASLRVVVNTGCHLSIQ